MQIDLKQQTLMPGVFMAILSLGTSINFQIIDMPTMSYTMLALQLICFVMAAYFIIRQGSISIVDFVCILFLSLIAVSTIVNGTDIRNWFYLSCHCGLLFFSFNYFSANLKPLVIGLTIGFNIAIVAQLYQLVLHPEMWMFEEVKESSGYLLGGNYNQMGGYLLVTFVLNMLCNKFGKKFLFMTVPMYIVCLAVPVIVGSMTALTCLALFAVISIVPKNIQRWIIYPLFGSILLFQIVVCFNGKGIDSYDWAVWFVEDILHKDVTFTERTTMWASALKIIPDSILIGFGYPDKEWYLSNMSSFAIGPHNMLLAMLIYGGVIGLFLYVILLGHAIKSVVEENNRLSNMILGAIAIVCTMLLMETYPLPVVMMLFVLAEYYPNIKRLCCI